MNNHDIANQVETLRDEIVSNMSQIESLLSQAEGQAHERAKAYWIAHITMALTNDHGYLGGSMVTADDTINELRDEEEY